MKHHKKEHFYTKYFSISTPVGWTFKHSNNDCSNQLTYDNKKNISIAVYPKWEYDTTLSSIVSNIYGVHALIDEQTALAYPQNGSLLKTTILFEQSAADDFNNIEPLPTQLHYFLIKENQIIDFYPSASIACSKETTNIIQSTVFK